MAIEPETQELRAVVQGAPLARVVPASQNDLVLIATSGYRYVDQGQWEQARNAFDALTQLSPHLSVGYTGLGTVALKEGKFEEALESLTRSLQLNSSDPMVLANLGEAWLRLGQPNEAVTVLRAAVELDPGRRNPAANRARAMLAGIEDTGSKEAASPK